MQSVQFDGLKILEQDLDSLLKEIPSARKELHENISKIIKEEVDRAISSSGINDTNSKIRDWQETYVGSRGGYAAVNPKTGPIGPNSPGAITNYLENGHEIREPKGNAKKYKPRIKKPYVDGFHFYQSASNKVESKAIKEAEKFAKELKRRLEGEK